jgi:hypothetical protein
MALFSQSQLCLGAPDCPVVHRTMSGAPGWLRRTSALGKELTTFGYNSPDCPVCTGLSGEPTVGRAIGRLRQLRKEIRTGQCPVVHRTVRCTRRQKARIAFLECSQRLLAALGL